MIGTLGLLLNTLFQRTFSVAKSMAATLIGHAVHRGQIDVTSPAAIAALRTAIAADKVTWTWSLYGPPRAATVTFEHLAKVAKEKSGGNFIINLRYNEQLGEAKDFLDGIKVDSFQGAFVAYSYAPAKTPLRCRITTVCVTSTPRASAARLRPPPGHADGQCGMA